jgi:hypothetical protein
MNKKTVAWFEEEQGRFGTEVALENFVIMLAQDMLKQNAGIAGISLRTPEESRARLRREGVEVG